MRRPIRRTSTRRARRRLPHGAPWPSRGRAAMPVRQAVGQASNRPTATAIARCPLKNHDRRAPGRQHRRRCQAGRGGGRPVERRAGLDALIGRMRHASAARAGAWNEVAQHRRAQQNRPRAPEIRALLHLCRAPEGPTHEGKSPPSCAGARAASSLGPGCARSTACPKQSTVCRSRPGAAPQASAASTRQGP